MRERTAVTAAMQQLLGSAGATARSVWSGTSPRLHHLEAGAGEPLVLLHGGTGGGANWFRMIPLLAAHFRLLAPDFPGFGLSDPMRPARPLGVTAADLLAQWLDANGVSRAHFFGTSFGGLVALRIAQRDPARVASLALLDSAGLGADIHPLVRLASARATARLLLQPSRAGTRFLVQRLLTSDLSDVGAAQLDGLIDYIHQSGRAAGSAYVVETLRAFASPRGQREVLAAAELRAIPHRAVVMWGERDRLLPLRHAHEAAAALPRASLHVLSHVGHSPNWEAPRRVADTLLAALP